MIIRIFQVSIKPEYRQEFERDFKKISIDTVKNHEGLISYHAAGPTRWNPNDYALVTYWKDENSLVSFAGENWNQAVIPQEMQKYPTSYSVVHYNTEING